ncbi:DDE-type integrase/transposase/recombinase [Mesorhizobium sp. M0643]|uniref:DDE-type integrase/transposase/recombinase n=1 Tax=Mesorhizobium sp. M0643 TaxID=2956978 RepID=UPI003339DDB8
MRQYQGYRSESWQIDETYVRVGLEMEYLFSAVDKHGRLIDFMLSDRRNIGPSIACCAKPCGYVPPRRCRGCGAQTGGDIARRSAGEFFDRNASAIA